MAKLTGRVTIKVDAETLRTANGSSLDPGGVTRTRVVDDQGRVHFTEETRASEVSCTVLHAADTDVERIKNATNLSITFEADSGAQYAVPGSFLEEPGAISGGEWPITFVGQPAKRIA
jgi:hypothetical protein